jgi:hypothetical protein
VILHYAYAASGVPHEGRYPCIEQPENYTSNEQAVVIAKRYPVGQAIAVFHHPTRVAESRLTAMEPRIEFMLDVMFGCLWTLVGVGGVLLSRAVLRR